MPNCSIPTGYRHVKALVKKPVFNESGNRTGFEEHVVNLISDVMELEAFAMLELYKQRWFRDFLINKPQIANEYERLKQSLLPTYMNNRDGYTEAKTGFVHCIINMVKHNY